MERWSYSTAAAVRSNDITGHSSSVPAAIFSSASRNRRAALSAMAADEADSLSDMLGKCDHHDHAHIHVSASVRDLQFPCVVDGYVINLITMCDFLFAAHTTCMCSGLS
jgi:hypothetical protein